jgi:GT2 family glycosyltransferase
MKVSVIIVNYNGKDYLKECVDSVLKTEFRDFEVIVVDNASTDGSARGLDNRVRLIRSKTNLFFTGGCNLGARQAKGQWLVFLNPDTVVSPDWLRALWRQAKDKKLCLQPKIKIFGTDKIDCVIGKYVWPGFGVAVGRGKQDNYQGIIKGDYANGTCLMINKEWFFELSGLDENFKFFYEDVDLQLRARKRGGRAIGVMPAVIWHKGSLSFKQNTAPAYVKFYYRRNIWLTWLKNHSGWINEQRINEVRQIIKKKRFSWLDLGCGEGELVDLAKQQGIKAVGFDQKSGGKIEKLKLKQKYDAVSLYHVLEHLPAPEKVLKQAKQWLKPGGILVLEVPLVGNLTEKFLGKKYFIYTDKTHQNFWIKKQLIKLLADNGWRIIKEESCWYEFPLALLRRGGVLGIFLWLPYKILSMLGKNTEIIRLCLTKVRPLLKTA